MEDTVVFEVYEHTTNNKRCTEPGMSYRDREENLDECLFCEEPMEHTETIEVDTTLPETTSKMKNFISGLSEYERAIFLGMAMRSLRGNWGNPERRVAIIGEICQIGVGGELSQEFLDATENRARDFMMKKRAKYQYADGRTFRGERDGCYGKVWDEVGKPLDEIEDLAPFLPNDMHYGDGYFEWERERSTA